MIKRAFFARALAAAVLLPLALPLFPVACSGATTVDADGPDVVASKPRQVALEHEECNLDSSDRLPFDANGDGRPEILSVRDGGREVCRAVDANLDGVIDVYVYFDDQGRPRRRESGFDRNDQPDEVSFFENGVLVRKERETNNDRKVDTWDYYEGGRLVREERDSTGDGFVDQWWTFDRPNQPDCAHVRRDADGDGRPDPGGDVDYCEDTGPAPKPALAADAGAPPAADAGTEAEDAGGAADDGGTEPAAPPAPPAATAPATTPPAPSAPAKTPPAPSAAPPAKAPGDEPY